jgi:hypothetical protein
MSLFSDFYLKREPNERSDAHTNRGSLFGNNRNRSAGVAGRRRRPGPHRVSRYPVVTVPGPQALRIRAAITDIDTVNPALNLRTTVAVLVPLDMGGATIEVEFLDAESGERLAAMVDRKTGSPLKIFSGYSRLAHARGAFDQWADELKLALVENP